MFGYIAPMLSALTEEQRERYRSFYCGVCHALRDRFGSLTRVSLSNDMTFLALLLSSLYDPETTDEIARCGVHPLKKHPLRRSSAIDYAADMNALLFWYKCRDARMDDASLKGRAGEKAFTAAAAAVRSRWPNQARDVEKSLEALWALERSPDVQADALCNLSGQMLGAVFVPRPDDIWAPELRAVGEGLGRFVYWMDAWEDYDEDRKKDRFNPLTPWRDRPDYETFCHDTLELLISEAVAHFEVLPLSDHLDLMRNVLYAGVWQRYMLITEKKRKKEKKEEDAHAE